MATRSKTRPRRSVSSKNSMPRRSNSSSTLLHVGEAEAEVAGQVLVVELELARRCSPSSRRPRAAARAAPATAPPAARAGGCADAQRVQQLQPQALPLVERRADVALQRLEAARRQRRARRPPPSPRRARRAETGNTSGVTPSSAARSRPRTAITSRAAPASVSRMSILLIDDHDLLAPVADRLQEGALALGERAVGGGDEQHQVGAGHELARQRLVLADHGVGARRVHDVDRRAAAPPARSRASSAVGPAARARPSGP